LSKILSCSVRETTSSISFSFLPSRFFFFFCLVLFGLLSSFSPVFFFFSLGPGAVQYYRSRFGEPAPSLSPLFSLAPFSVKRFRFRNFVSPWDPPIEGPPQVEESLEPGSEFDPFPVLFPFSYLFSHLHLSFSFFTFSLGAFSNVFRVSINQRQVPNYLFFSYPLRSLTSLTIIFRFPPFDRSNSHLINGWSPSRPGFFPCRTNLFFR